MTTAATPEELAQFLSLHHVSRPDGPAIFALTPSSLAITFQRQQIRALNLVHAICKCKLWSEHEPLKDRPAPEQARVAVIGGGLAGVTTAAGLLKKGFEVHLFEQRSELCHLQSGCETRWLHPAIYDWPAPNSDFSDARLPLLNWSAGTAGQVARHVLRQFDKIVKESNGRYHQYLRSNAQLLDGRLHWDNADLRDPGMQGAQFLGRGGCADFDVVIIAVGFGVERGVLDPTNASTSYWRNDRYGQPRPWIRSERRDIVFISGDGDGGLLDLVRVCLRGFKHDRIIDDLFAGQDLLVESLRQIRDNHLSELQGNQNASLLRPFSELYKTSDIRLNEQVKVVETRMKERLRTDTRAILNGRAKSFVGVLRAEGRSFLNVLLTYALYHLGAFSYIPGNCNVSDSGTSVDIEGYGHLEYDLGIRRHGTERETVLEAVGLTPGEVKALFSRQNASGLQRLAGRQWPPGWWSLPPNESSSGLLNETEGDPEWLERVPRLEHALAIAFLAPLNQQLADLESMAGCCFRVTLHRTMHVVRGSDVLHCYQQVAPYFGNADSGRMGGQAGRVFYTIPKHEKCGSVGVTIRQGVAFVSQLPRDMHDRKLNKWKKLWKRLVPSSEDEEGLLRHRHMDPERVTTVATVPIYARLNDDEHVVRFVIYVDVEHAEKTMERPDIAALTRLLWAASRGIVDGVKHLREAKHDDHPLLGLRSAVRDTEGISIDGEEGKPLGAFSWLQSNFNDVVQTQRRLGPAYELPDMDELELHAEG